MQLIEPHFKWSEDSSFKFQEALTSVDIQKNLSDLANSDIQNSLSSLDNAVDKLKDIIISAATRSLKKSRSRTTCPTNNKSKKWFDYDLKRTRNRLINIARVMSQYPKDPLVRGNFFKQRKQYAKLCKNKRVQYRQSLITRLDALNEENPKLYWNLINHLLDKNNTVDTPIHPVRWLDHFMKLK